MRKLKYKRGHFYVSWFTLGNGHKTRFHILCKFSIPYEVPPLINVRPPKSISYTLSGSNIEIFDLPWGLFSVFSVFFKNDVTFPICLNSICKEKKYNFSFRELSLLVVWKEGVYRDFSKSSIKAYSDISSWVYSVRIPCFLKVEKICFVLIG